MGGKDRHCGGMPAMSGRLVGPAQLVSAAVLGSADPGQTSPDHTHRWPMAMPQRQLRAVHLHRSTAWDGGASCATDTACGRLLAHSVGGRPGERLAARLGFVGNRTTILRHLMRRQPLLDHSAPRVVGLDEWASRKGLRFGTIAVDLERRTVIDILPDRSVVSTAAWLAERPSIELIARDRDGLYADASRQGAPQARQIADRFHLVQNLRDRIERHLSGRRQRPVGPTEERLDGADRANLDRADRLEGLQRLFARVHELFRQGWTVADIARHLDVNRRRVDKWVRLEALPERFQCDPKPTSPMRFHAPLQELMRKGVTKIRWLFDEAKKLGYKGSFGHLARYVAHVRSLARANGSPAPAERRPRRP